MAECAYFLIPIPSWDQVKQDVLHSDSYTRLNIVQETHIPSQGRGGVGAMTSGGGGGGGGGGVLAPSLISTVMALERDMKRLA